jgi:hypothetical protein
MSAFTSKTCMTLNIGITVITLTLSACVSTAFAQTLLFRDDFSDPNLTNWTLLGSGGVMTNVNQQLVRYANCGPAQTNNPMATHFPFLHPLPKLGVLPNNSTLEGRADLVSANQNDAWASIHFLWNLWYSGQGYIFYKDQDEIGLVKFWNGGNSCAWFFYEQREIKNTNVTLVLALTRRDSNLEIETRVLDKDNANAVLYYRIVWDTPRADPALPNRSVRGTPSTSDVAGLAWPLLDSPTYVEGELQWANPEHAPMGNAQVIYDNFEVWQRPAPRPYVVAWGADQYGATFIPSGLSNVVAVVAGAGTSMALRSDGTIVAWGGDYFGQNYNTPPPLSNVVAIAAGGGTGGMSTMVSHSLALRADGTVVLWGQGWDGTNACFCIPLTWVPDGLSNVVAVAAGANHSLALRSDGTVVAWVSPEYGFESNAVSQIETVPADVTNAVAVAAGANHSLALRDNGTVVAWGDAEYGETNVPAGLSNVVAVAAGLTHCLALRADGTLVAWGAYFNGGVTNLGMAVPPGLSNVVSISAGQDHSLALRADGTIFAWGANWLGQINVPYGLTNVIALADGSFHGLAIVGDGRPVVRAALRDPTKEANGFSVYVPTQSGRVYALEYKNSLADTEWSRLPLVAGTGQERALTDPSASGSTQRFYRVRRW